MSLSIQLPANNFLTSAPHFQREDVALNKGERWSEEGEGGVTFTKLGKPMPV